MLFQKVDLMFRCVQIIAKRGQVCYLKRNQIDVGRHRACDLLGCVSILIDVAKDFIAAHQDFRCYNVGFIFRFGFHVIEHELMNRSGFRHTYSDEASHALIHVCTQCAAYFHSDGYSGK